MATRNLYDRKSVEAMVLYPSSAATQALSELQESGIDVVHLVTLARLLAPPEETSVLPLPTPILPLHSSVTKESMLESPWKPTTTRNASTRWHAIRDALKHGRIERAVRIALTVSDSADLRSLLASFSLNTEWLSLLPSMPKDRVLLHAFANKTTPQAIVTPNAANESQTGRCFSIDPRALALWGIPTLPASLLIGSPLWVAEADASPWWKAALQKYGIVVRNGSLEGATDEATEAFYTECFPLDIPDEWSSKERAKSHGLFMPSSVVSVPNPWTHFLPK